MRTRVSATADDLREHAMDRVRVDKGDFQAEKSLFRPVVDELRAFGLELAQRRADVVDLVRNVVHTGPSLGEELADGCLLTERGQQLDPRLADAQRRRLHALVGNGFAVLELR